MTAVDVKLVPVEPGAADDPALCGRLSTAERDAVASLGFAADRDRAATARAAARLELGRRLGVHPRLVPLLAPELTGGAPSVRGSSIGLGWAHSGDWVALALAPGRRVGVDIEAIPARVPGRALALLGLASLREFVALEAAAKATGEGLAAAAWPPHVGVRPFATPAGYVGAVAATGHDWTLRIDPASALERPAAASATAAGLWDQSGVGACARSVARAARDLRR